MFCAEVVEYEIKHDSVVAVPADYFEQALAVEASAAVASSAKATGAAAVSGNLTSHEAIVSRLDRQVRTVDQSPATVATAAAAAAAAAAGHAQSRSARHTTRDGDQLCSAADCKCSLRNASGAWCRTACGSAGEPCG